MPPFDRTELRSARLLLRPLQAGDAQALLEIFSDAAVMRYWSTPAWTSIE
ncbi:MAG: GNAT family N-acetyltransferase, partial [Burkholderiales bacterium]|nr:GNAT family N-acetyltransferase [Burkholderiales bacterium]